MEGLMRVAKWGNSLAVRLPAELVAELGLKDGDEVQITANADGIALKRTPDRLELLAEMRKYRGSRPADFIFDRDEIYQRGSINED